MLFPRIRLGQYDTIIKQCKYPIFPRIRLGQYETIIKHENIKNQ